MESIILFAICAIVGGLAVEFKNGMRARVVSDLRVIEAEIDAVATRATYDFSEVDNLHGLLMQRNELSLKAAQMGLQA